MRARVLLKYSLSPWAVLALLGCLAVCLAGCEEMNTQQKMNRAQNNRLGPDEEFEKGKDRPATAKTLYAAAKVLSSQQRDDEAEFLFNRLIAEHPRFLPSYCGLSEIKMRNRRMDDAVKVLKQGLAISPTEPILLNNLGTCFLMKGDYATALDYFTRAAAAQPDNARYRGNMATCLGLLGRFEEAESLYLQILSPADVRHNLAVLYEARATLVEGVRSSPSRPTTVGEIGGFILPRADDAASPPTP